MQIRKLYGAPTASANAVAQLDILRGGDLVGVLFDIQSTGAADNDSARAILSLSSSRSDTTNDVTGDIASVSVHTELVTSGCPPAFLNMFIPIPRLSLPAGSRVYFHATIAGTLTLTTNIYLYLA